MLEQITWSEYWTMVGTTTAVYYVGIGLLFYREKIISAFNPLSPPSNYVNKVPDNVMGTILSESTMTDAPSSEKKTRDKEQDEILEEDQTPENIRTLDKSTETGDLINAALSELGVNTNSDELVTTISTIIKKQNLNKELAPFREALDWHIHQTALDSCGIALEKKELDTIWSTP